MYAFDKIKIILKINYVIIVTHAATQLNELQQSNKQPKFHNIEIKSNMTQLCN